MIEGYFGLPGSGKTYYAVKEAKKRIAHGEKVYANFHIEGAKYFKDFDEFLEMQECTVIIDEAGIWLNARKWGSISEEILYRFMESRKYKFDLLYTAQNPEMVEITLRRITNYMWYMRRYGRKEWIYKKDGTKKHRKAWFHTASLWEPERYRKAREKPLLKYYFKIKPEIYSLYDTEKVIIRPNARKQEDSLWRNDIDITKIKK